MSDAKRVLWSVFWVGGLLLFGVGCATSPRPGQLVARTGDEIVVAGQFVHTGTPVVLWMDPGGYDAYRVERRFSPLDQSDWETSHTEVEDLRMPNRYGLRQSGILTEGELEQVRGGGWTLEQVQAVVDQFVLHFDVCGTSQRCFDVLHDHRGLSVHFMLDVDGTIYQTLDLKERAWHATTSNTRSVGIEIANMGAYRSADARALREWYGKDASGQTILTIPEKLQAGVRTRGFVGRPARPEPVEGEVQGQSLYQYDYTPEQYRALVKLTATLCRVFPKLACEYPRDEEGRLVLHKLAKEELDNYRGVLGHFHVQTNKTDPGPAMQWDYLIENARALIEPEARHGAVELMRKDPTPLAGDRNEPASPSGR